MKYLLKRLSEPSSYASLAGLFALIGVNLPPDMVSYGVQALAGVCGLAGILIGERR